MNTRELKGHAFVGSQRSFTSAQDHYRFPKDFKAINGDTIAPFQYEGARFLADHRHCLLADDMGIGKTVQALVSIAPWERVLLTCPKVARYNWQKECRKWRPDLIPTIADEFRRPSPGEILIMTHFGLPKPYNRRVLTNEIMHDVRLIIDEAQAVKGGNAIITDRHRLLGSQCASVQGLTGTPMPGTPLDLWGVLLSLKIAHIAFPGYVETHIDDKTGYPVEYKVTPFEQFKRLCNGERVTLRKRREGKWVDVSVNKFKWGTILPEVRERLKTVMLRRTKAEVLPDLPPKRYQDIIVDAPEDLIPYLNEVKDQWDLVDQQDLPPFELVAEARAALARSRIPAAMEIADGASLSCPMIVFSSHIEPIEEIGRLPGFRMITGPTNEKKRQEAVDLFQGGKIRGIAITTDSGGTALTLTKAQSELFVDLDWTPATNQQAEDRAVRRGTIHSVHIMRMTSNHPLDMRIDEILKEKQRMIKEVFG